MGLVTCHSLTRILGRRCTILMTRGLIPAMKNTLDPKIFFVKVGILTIFDKQTNT